MSPQSYRKALKRLALTHERAAEFFGVTLVTSKRWAKLGGPGPSPPARVLMKLAMDGKIKVDEVNRMMKISRVMHR